AAVGGPALPARHRRGLALGQLGGRAHAAVGAPLREQLLDRGVVALPALALAEGPLVPVEVEPAQAVEDGGLRLARRALGVGVLDAQHEGAAVPAREGPVEEGGACPAHVQEPRGARREAGTDAPRGEAYQCGRGAPGARAQRSRRPAAAARLLRGLRICYTLCRQAPVFPILSPVGGPAL